MNLLATREDYLHIDTFDLYQSRPRQTFINQASIELGVKDEVIKKDLSKVLRKLEALQDQQINNGDITEKPPHELADTERQQGH